MRLFAEESGGHLCEKGRVAATLSSPLFRGEVAERSEVACPERSRGDGGAVPVGPCLTLRHPHLTSPSEEGEG